jgi:cytochrome P450
VPAESEGAALLEYPSLDLIECPYPFFEEARSGPGVAVSATNGHYLVFGHAEIAFVLRRPEIFSNRFPEGRPNFDYRGATMISHYDPPEHKEIRSFAYSPLTPGRLRSYEPIVRRVSEDLVEEIADRGEVEFVREFAALLPAIVICTLMDIPTQGEEFDAILSDWGGNGTGISGSVHDDPDEKAARAVRRNDYIAGLLQERYERPGADLLSELVRRQVERDGTFDLPYLVPISNELIAGGIITTAHLMSSAMMLLIQHPEQMRKVCASYALIPRMLEETLRLESPVQSQARRAAVDTELGGIAIPAGSRVLCVLASGNRDPRQFSRPDEFDVERPISTLKQHLAFGYGAHFCLGAPLARLEATTAFETLFDRLDGFRLAEQVELSHAPTTHFRALVRLPLAFERRVG